MGTCTGVAPALYCLVAGLLWTGTVICSPDPEGYYHGGYYSSTTEHWGPRTDKVEPYLRILNISNNITFNVGDKKIIYCEGRFLHNDIGWYDPFGMKIQERVNKSDNIFVDLRVGSAEEPTLLALLLWKMVVTDSGTYTCRAGDLSARVNITVNDPPTEKVKPYLILNTSKNITVNVGAKRIIYCEGRYLHNDIGWYNPAGVKIQQRVNQSDRIFVDFRVGSAEDPTSLALLLWKMVVTDSGTYTCRAGDLSARVNITVNGKYGATNGTPGVPTWQNPPSGVYQAYITGPSKPGVEGPGFSGGSNNGPILGPGAEILTEWHIGPIGGQPSVGGPGGWKYGPIGGQPGVGGAGGWNNGPIGGQPGVGGPGGWNNGPIGGQPGVGGPEGWKYGPLGGPPGFPTPVPSGGWNNGPTNTNQDMAKKADSEKLTVCTSGSSSPHEVHFALSLVSLLRAQPLPARLQKEADILRGFATVDPPGFNRPFESPGLDW